MRKNNYEFDQAESKSAQANRPIAAVNRLITSSMGDYPNLRFCNKYRWRPMRSMRPDLCPSYSGKQSFAFIMPVLIKRRYVPSYSSCIAGQDSMDSIHSFSCIAVVHSTKVANFDNTKDRMQAMFFRG